MIKKTALFIGRFQPFHLGHLDAIKQILKTHKKVIIGIGSSQYRGESKNPFSAALREKMINSSLRDAKIPRTRFKIVRIPDIHNDNKWVEHAERLCPQFNAVYSGTEKVQKLFEKHGKHPVFAPEFNIKISATQIRKKMAAKKNWAHLVPKTVGKLITNL